MSTFGPVFISSRHFLPWPLNETSNHKSTSNLQVLLSLMDSSAYNRIEGLNFVVSLVIYGTDDCTELSALDIHLTLKSAYADNSVFIYT